MSISDAVKEARIEMAHIASIIIARGYTAIDFDHVLNRILSEEMNRLTKESK